ncbi:MAG: MqnA/MqnD/SBP family protein [Oscillospiraceae bacterium]
MKKTLSILLSAVLAMGLLASCGSAAPSSAVSKAESVAAPSSKAESVPQSAVAAEQTIFRIASLKGPTTMGMVKLMEDAEAKATANDYQVTMYGAADEIAPKLISGDIDVALIPANLASTLYAKTEGKIQAAAVNTLGVLYIVGTGDAMASIKDLKGKTIYATGKGTTPEYVLNYVLQKNGLVPGTDVTIEYKSEATEVAAAMKASSGYPIALLPQPYATALKGELPELKTMFDMTAEWNKVSPESALVTGVMVARKDFIEKNADAFTVFMQDYKSSTEWVNANTDDAAALVVKYGIVPKPELAKKALPLCNITFIEGADMQAKLEGYLSVLNEQNPKAIGGAMPDEGFYYKK